MDYDKHPAATLAVIGYVFEQARRAERWLEAADQATVMIIDRYFSDDSAPVRPTRAYVGESNGAQRVLLATTDGRKFLMPGIGLPVEALPAVAFELNVRLGLDSWEGR